MEPMVMIHRTKIFQNWQQKYMEVIFYQEYVQIKNVRRRFDPVRWSKGRGPTKLNVDVVVGCRPGVIDWSRTITSYFNAQSESKSDTARVFKIFLQSRTWLIVSLTVRGTLVSRTLYRNSWCVYFQFLQ